MTTQVPSEPTLERTITAGPATYLLQRWDGVNRSGATPMCDNVLVLVDPAAPAHRGIIFTDQKVDELTLSSVTGIIIAGGPQAFAYDADRLVVWEGRRPQAGERVWFRRYTGQEYYGRDGKLYRVMRDREIQLVELPDEAVAALPAAA